MKRKKKITLEEVLMDKSFEDELVEISLDKYVFKIVFFFLFLIVFVVFLKLFYLIFLKGDFYKKRAFLNNVIIVNKLAPRGIIKDRFGKPLLENKAIADVYLTSQFLNYDLNQKREFLKKISSILEIPQTDLENKIKEYDWNKNQKLLLKRDISHEELLSLSNLESPELEIVQSLRRDYRNFIPFAHVLGYVGLVTQEDLDRNPNLILEDLIGKTGLEAYYDVFLRGENGYEIFLKNVKGEKFEKIKTQEPRAGNDLEITLDGDFQEFVYKRLKEGLIALGRERGLALAINPQNGEVLALVSLPSFEVEKIPELIKKNNTPLFNRIVSGLYNPGSTIKPLVGIAALKEGVIDPYKKIYSAGFIEIPNPYYPDQPSRFLDWKAHGWVDLVSALARSSNIYFYAVGGGLKMEDGSYQQGLGIENLKKWWLKFGLGGKTGIDLPYEKTGILPDPSWKKEKLKQNWLLGDTYNVSIGQGDLMVSPLALINYFSALVNGGKIYQLHLKKGETKILRDLSEEIRPYLNFVLRGLEDAVLKPYGTAYLLSDLPFKVGAKTGTAQVAGNQKINAIFLGYLQDKDKEPELVLMILIEDAREGSLNTLPIAKDIFSWYYKNRIYGRDNLFNSRSF